MNLPDRGYVNLLGHLQHEKQTLALEAIEAAICHYLVHTPPHLTSPTPLTAAVISSPIWQPLTFATAKSLTNTFRSAILLKYKYLRDEPRSIFQASAKRSLANWLDAVLLGLQNGDPLLRLAVSGGLLLGIQDPSMQTAQRRRLHLEQELVVTLAELLDMYSREAYDNWDADFPSSSNVQNGLNLTVLLASQFFGYVSDDMIKALSLNSLADACMLSIQSAFHQGTVLKHLKSSVNQSENNQLKIDRQSSFVTELESLIHSDEFSCAGALCKLLSRTIAVSTIHISTKRRAETWGMLQNLSSILNKLTAEVEKTWINVPEVHALDDEAISPDSLETMTNVWTVLKTLLFSTVMLSQALLSTIIYVPPPKTSSSSQQFTSSVELATSVLEILHHLSFIISKFGGVVATESDATGDVGGFKELKRVFYTALDILSSDAMQSEAFVNRLAGHSADAGPSGSNQGLNVYMSAKKAYELASVEQLIPVLSETCIERDVVPMCQPYLGDPSHRETYESAHSVLLSVFAAHADMAMKGPDNLATRLVPGYVKSLLDNSQEGKLSTPQLRLAYAALVRSASGGETRLISQSSPPDTDILARFCISELLSSIQRTSDGYKCSADKEEIGRLQAEHEKLSLTLISLVPNLSPALLCRVLDELETLIAAEHDQERKTLFIDELFQEILHSVGEGGKEHVMRWWHEKFTSASRGVTIENEGGQAC